MTEPAKLGQRAKDLWNGVLNEVELDSAGLAILEDACRTIDIVDRLSGALSSKKQEWIRVDEDARVLADEHGAVEIHLVINPLLGEIRQQRLALKQFLAQLKLGIATPKTEESAEKDIFQRLEEQFADGD